ncbi:MULTISPECIES: cytochrome b [Halomonadaceae]|uniref:cytochrome b n=1 Tax=Halomonadaceae TaxID=28256 RepID=UPI00159A79E0|nr:MULTISPECIES: cytochrome b [Halomonas]QJQ96276.1 cytochrome b [Halomonas sp. PA5]
MQIFDSGLRYGGVSRLLHWSMALLLMWQFASAIARVLASETALDEFLWSTHRELGALLMLLVVVRGIWGVINASRRPPALSVMARLGHLALYALMIAVPLIALIRQYGSGRAFSPFGVPLMSGFEGERIEWMVALGGQFHGLLGWTLLALVVGHVGMAILHKRLGGQDVMTRMTSLRR